MGRHAADRTAPGSPDPDFRGNSAGHRRSRYADPHAPKRGGTAPGFSAERAAVIFDRLVAPHHSALRAYVLRNTNGDEVVAESILKETLYWASQEPARYPQRASAVRPWLILTARNVLHDRERQAQAGHDDRPPTSRPAQRPAGGAPATTIVAAMQELTTEHRELIVRTFYGGASLEDVAAERGVPVAKVKTDLFYAMHTLRAVLDKQVADRHGIH